MTTRTPVDVEPEVDVLDPIDALAPMVDGR
jgi:hypothetical protein